MKRILLFIIGLSMSVHAVDLNAQSFTPVDSGFHTLHNTAAAWVDLDNDGDLDIFVTGSDTIDLPAAYIYQNDGGNNFSIIQTSITPCSFAACAFGDMDNDGFADLALSGNDGNSNICKVYRNDGGMQFSDISAGIEGVKEGSLEWADYDNDGFSDLLMSGLNNSGNAVSKLYRNEAGTTFTEIAQPISGLYKSSLACFDIDQDQDIDFAICGLDNSGLAQTYVYLNEDGDYTELGAGLEGLYGGMLDWGDYNNDGYADLLISGSDDNAVSRTKVYRNDGGNSFTSLPGPFNAVSNGSSFWGDFNNDGFLDFVVAGRYRSGISPPPPSADPFMTIYHYDSGDNFQPQWVGQPIPDMNHIVCGDYDNDSDLDLLLTGAFVNAIGANDDRSMILSNDVTVSNNPPSAPTDLEHSISGNEMSFQWTGSSDDKTPDDGLNYNLRIGSQDDNMDFMSALADLNNGHRRVAEAGNAGPNTEHHILGLPFGEYYVSVQAIDPSFAGSSFSDIDTILYIPTATFDVVDTSCTGEPVTLFYTGNASPDADYDWDFDGAEQLGGPSQMPVIEWNTPGLKTVTLIVTENGMSSDPVSHDVMLVDPVTSAGTLSGETEFCQGTDSTDYILAPQLSGAEYYQWYLDPAEAGTVVGTGLEVTVAWDPGFSGTAHLSASGANFCGPGPVSNILVITVDPKPVKPGTPDGPENLCQNPGNSTYSSIDSLTGISYEWVLIPEEAGSILVNGLAEAEVNWDDSYTGDAGIFVIYENTCGTGPPSDTLDITIEERPVANAGEDQKIPEQTYTQLQGSASGGSGSYSFYWMPDSLLEDPSISNPTTHLLNSSVQFFLTVTDEETGCTSLDDVLIEVYGGPMSVVASADSTNVCEGTAVQLLALASGGLQNKSYSWTSNPAGFTSDISNPIAVVFETITFHVEVTDGDQTAHDSVEVVVRPLPDAPTEIEGPEMLCEGDENILFEINPVTDATYYIWELSEGMVGSSDSASIMVSFADPFIAGTGVITVWAANNCGTSTDSSFLNILVASAPGQPQMVFGPDSLCTTTDTIVQYTLDVPVPQATEYEWQVLPEEAGYIVGSGTTATMHWQQNWEGEAVIWVRAINNCGFSDWSEQFNVTTFTCVGISEAENIGFEVSLYPNPARNILTIEYSILREQSDLELGLYDMLGRQRGLVPMNSSDSKIQLDVSYLPLGLYIIRVSKSGLVLATNKLIISR